MSDADNLIQSEIDNALFNFKNANYHEAIKILEKLKKKTNSFYNLLVFRTFIF